MNIENITSDLYALADKQQAEKMAAYMRNLFPFLGIPAPLRKSVYKIPFRKDLQDGQLDLPFVATCFALPEREFQYVACDYLLFFRKHLSPTHLPYLKELIETKSWWDTVDGLDGVVGSIIQRYPETKSVMLEWSKDANLWVRRVAIDHQLNFKNSTDQDLLATILQNNFGSDEFFINKAIGWSLRDYSKSNPEWVSSFVHNNRSLMNSLSIREASKYLPNTTKKDPLY